MTKNTSCTETTQAEFPKQCGNHHSSLVGYTVQALFENDAPRMIAGQIFDNRWRDVSFQKAPDGLGVPVGDRFNTELIKHGLYGYEAAQALRWWLHAVARAEGNEYCLSTRLIAHKVVSETTVTAEKPIEECSYKRGLDA